MAQDLFDRVRLVGLLFKIFELVLTSILLSPVRFFTNLILTINYGGWTQQDPSEALGLKTNMMWNSH